jgi:hypothetical protein
MAEAVTAAEEMAVVKASAVKTVYAMAQAVKAVEKAVEKAVVIVMDVQRQM